MLKYLLVFVTFVIPSFCFATAPDFFLSKKLDKNVFCLASVQKQEKSVSAQDPFGQEKKIAYLPGYPSKWWFDLDKQQHWRYVSPTHFEVYESGEILFITEDSTETIITNIAPRQINCVGGT